MSSLSPSKLFSIHYFPNTFIFRVFIKPIGAPIAALGFWSSYCLQYSVLILHDVVLLIFVQCLVIRLEMNSWKQRIWIPHSASHWESHISHCFHQQSWTSHGVSHPEFPKHLIIFRSLRTATLGWAWTWFLALPESETLVPSVGGNISNWLLGWFPRKSHIAI